MTEQLLQTVIVSVATGVVSTCSTVVALRVHIHWLRESIKRLDAAINRAHERIDDMKKRGVSHGR